VTFQFRGQNPRRLLFEICGQILRGKLKTVNHSNVAVGRTLRGKEETVGFSNFVVETDSSVQSEIFNQSDLKKTKELCSLVLSAV